MKKMTGRKVLSFAMASAMTMGMGTAAMADGVILDLTDLINEYCPNLKAYLEANPDVDRQVKMDSGKYYVFPSVKEIDEGCTCMGPMLRKDLLDKLGLEVPETIDE